MQGDKAGGHIQVKLRALILGDAINGQDDAARHRFGDRTQVALRAGAVVFRQLKRRRGAIGNGNRLIGRARIGRGQRRFEISPILPAEPVKLPLPRLKNAISAATSSSDRNPSPAS